ncbi:MAG: amino acid permease [Gaiellaceae bacterium]
MSDTPAEPSALPDDRATLHKLGYAQELYRSMGGFQNFAISFTIISILAGCLTSYAIGFNQGGPVAITWGWLIVGLACTFVAMAMGEIASTYPTAGGLYFWASKLGGPGWGWFTGWFNLVGQIAVTAAIGFGCALFMTSLLNLLWNYPNSYGWIYFTYGMIMLASGLINMFKVTITAALNVFSAWWHMIGVAVIVVVLIAVPSHHQSFHYVFLQTVNNTGLGGTVTHGFIYLYVFLTGLLLAQYTITGYDASAHMSEETRNASLGAAWGMVMSVVVSVIFGFVLLVAVTFVIPAKGPSDTSAFIVQHIWQDSMGNNWAEFLILIAVVAQVFCTIASTTSASRMMFAFSRDGAVPGHRLWRKVSKRDRIPVNTVWAICVLAFLTPLPALWWGYVGYAASTAVAVIGLYIAFVIPIILRLRAGDSFERTAWNLGKWYKIVDWIAIVWIFFICLVFMLPAFQGGIPFKSNFLWTDFNYTPLPVFAAFLLFGGWYVLSARKWFKGPVRQGSADELAQIEAGFEAPGVPATSPAGQV